MADKVQSFDAPLTLSMACIARKSPPFSASYAPNNTARICRDAGIGNPALGPKLGAMSLRIGEG